MDQLNRKLYTELIGTPGKFSHGHSGSGLAQGRKIMNIFYECHKYHQLSLGSDAVEDNKYIPDVLKLVAYCSKQTSAESVVFLL